ncbi:DEAD/DEAH box helicase [Desulfurococcaceae archaeon MEX13E-LK6-19]|nr:DEAD/DEAH box helicase [Desulfurococcaceae archaeon MEX13E-LK6-19]
MGHWKNDIVPCIDLRNVFKDDGVITCLNKLGYKQISILQYNVFKYVSEGFSVIVVAPTGAGKTEAALFPILYKVYKRRQRPISVIYVTPLRALNRDIAERIEKIASCFGLSVNIRHGDTPRSLRRKIKENPPHILVTTPETLQYIIVDKTLREKLANLKYVVIDELREMITSKRGIELFSALDLIEKTIGKRIIKIGLTATLSRKDEAVSFFDGPSLTKIVESSTVRGMNIEIRTPKSEQHYTEMVREIDIEPDFFERVKYIVEKIRENGHTLVFANTRDLVERIAWALSVLFGDKVKIGVHHGSLSRSHRLSVEKAFKRGEINALVATSSLELGLDIGVVKYVIQYMSPRQVSRLVQRIGRSLHRYSLKPRGSIITIDNFYDMIESIVIARRSIENLIENEEIPQRPLDVLAHQICAKIFIEPGISLEKLYHEFYSNRVFRGIDYDDFEKVIEYLVYTRILKIQNNKVYPSYRAKIYYYKTTMIPDVRNIDVIDVSSGKKIGVLNEEFVTLNCEYNTIIVLGGGIWKVIDYNNTEGKLYVEPLESTREEIIIPKWEGESIPVDYMVTREAGALLRLLSMNVNANNSADFFRIPIFRHKINEYKKSIVIDKTIKEKIVNVIKNAMEELGIIPSDRNIVVEVCSNEKIIAFYTFLGSKANNLLKEILTALFRRYYLTDITAYSSPYYVIFQTVHRPSRNDVINIVNQLIDVFDKYGEDALTEIVMNSNAYLWRIFFVAQRFGAIDPSKVKVTKTLLKGYKDSIIGVEALKETMLRDYDISVVRKIVDGIKRGTVKIHVVETKKPSILLKEALSRIPGVYRIYKTIDLDAYKLRLLNKEVTVICLLCGNAFRLKLNSIVGEDNIACPKCSSRALAVVKGDGKEEIDVVRKVLSKKRLKGEEKNLYKELQKKAMLVMNYGADAIIALAGYGVGVVEASRILYKHKAFNEDLFKLIYEAEKKFLRIKKYLD